MPRLSALHTLPSNISIPESSSVSASHTRSAINTQSLGHDINCQSQARGDISSSSTPCSASTWSISRMSSYSGNYPPTLTPITNSEGSPQPHEKMTMTMTSPPSRKRSFDELNGTATLTPTQTPPDSRRQARPGPGQVKGSKLVFDPDTAAGLDSSSRKRLKPKYNTFGDTHDTTSSGDPRLLFPDYPVSAYRDQTKHNKARLRPAPYQLKSYPWDAKNSVGRGPAEQVVVHGFDPLLISELKIRAMLSQFGHITETKNMTDPSTGSFLGICTVNFGDKRGLKRSSKAAESARRAEREGNGQRIDQWQVRILQDSQGVRSDRMADAEIKRRKNSHQKDFRSTRPHNERSIPPPPAGPPPSLPTVTPSAPPPNAPKGPAPKAHTVAPRFVPQPAALPIPKPAPTPVTKSRLPLHPAMEETRVLPKLRRKPYIFIAKCYVPVLGTTVAHIQRRLKSYNWKAIRCDDTGYYIIFESGKHGQKEAQRMYDTCHLQQLFNYTMNMDLQKLGNPNYVRSPTPQRVAAEEAVRLEKQNIKQEDQEDFDNEIKQRADTLDPTLAALDILRAELTAIILVDIKAKLSNPIIFQHLDPKDSRNIEIRDKFNITDPQMVESQRVFAVARLESRAVAGALDPRGGVMNARKNKWFKTDSPRLSSQDERRVRRPKPVKPRQLHQMLLDDDSDDDERRTNVTRGSDGFDSRAISEAAQSPAHLEADDDGHRTPHKRRKMDRWGESDDESVDSPARKLLGDLLIHDVEDLSDDDLEKALNILPAADGFRKKALVELKRRRKVLQDDEMFTHKLTGLETPHDDTSSIAATPEPTLPAKSVKKKAVAKTKKKTKKQLQEEQDAARAEMEAKLDKVIEKAEAVQLVEDTAEADAMAEIRAEVEWGVSTAEPRRTVEDDFGVVLDVDGWQNVVKDKEDMLLLQSMLRQIPPAELECDADLWAFNRKEFKTLNTGVTGISHKSLEIPGYYVPTKSGCARTEPYVKIKESEKSQYLPHRIKVKNLREQRQAEAKKNPNGVPEIAASKATTKVTTKVSVASQRTHRAENRRLQNDVVQTVQTHGVDSDTFYDNALKKRKKCVRFDRSAIHGWGLYAEENIANHDMIIEYVGEKVRQRIADVREMQYDLQGVGSSYLFRIDDDMVIDATKKGGIARFINHSCMPNCTAKIIKVDGTKRIVIYAQRDIAKDEELTYDYKFEREIHSDDRIPCLCGTVACKGFLN